VKRGPGMGNSHSLMRIAAVALGLLSVTGCSFFLDEPVEMVQRLYFYDEFRWIDWQTWNIGVEPEGAPNEILDGNGYLLFQFPGHFLRTNDAWRGPLRVDLRWSVVSQGETLPATPDTLPVEAGDDFRIAFDRVGAYAALTLYRNGQDELSLRGPDGTLLADPVVVPTSYLTRGTLSVSYDPFGLNAGLTASVPELGLSVSAGLKSVIGDSSVTLWVSGTNNSPRGLDSVYVFGE